MLAFQFQQKRTKASIASKHHHVWECRPSLDAVMCTAAYATSHLMRSYTQRRPDSTTAGRYSQAANGDACARVISDWYRRRIYVRSTANGRRHNGTYTGVHMLSCDSEHTSVISWIRDAYNITPRFTSQQSPMNNACMVKGIVGRPETKTQTVN